ncbi:hypothetical protein BG32_15100 [Mesotoga sp. HF07.pep.5.2.highcov]|jgi:hypothetical protein|nr:hypothetical protein V513_01655 [Mesotoga sp. H07.pep.5.3]RLL85774.1 hypothetical protein Y696_05830 [Mesotoga sp. H07pep.5.4]RLL88067.1 hypothetical protein BG32_15100 [Mesotoga sp. HF07.pep.5.2.highcov]
MERIASVIKEAFKTFYLLAQSQPKSPSQQRLLTDSLADEFQMIRLLQEGESRRSKETMSIKKQRC